MSAMRRRDTGRGMELRRLPRERLLGEPTLRGPCRDQTATGALGLRIHSALPGRSAREGDGRACGARRPGRAQGAPDRSAGNAAASRDSRLGDGRDCPSVAFPKLPGRAVELDLSDSRRDTDGTLIARVEAVIPCADACCRPRPAGEPRGRSSSGIPADRAADRPQQERDPRCHRRARAVTEDRRPPAWPRRVSLPGPQAGRSARRRRRAAPDPREGK